MSVKNRSLGLLALLFGLAACGGSPMPAPGPGPGPGPGPSPTVSRIVLAQDDVLLENVGVSERLSARLLDAQGREVTGAVTWQVEKGAVASVAADGTVTGRSVGSTIVRATANGLTSAPIVVAVADLKDSVTRVPNERVVSPPVFASGAAPFQLGSRYTVVMRDVSPTAGRLWFSKAADGTPIQGQVVSSRPVANGVEVTLEVVPLGDVFDKLVVNESFELSSEDVTIPEATAAHFGVQRQSNGDLVLTPNKAPSGDKVGALAFNAGPFRCTGSDIEGKILLGSPSFRFNFGRPKVEVEVVIDSNFIDGQNTSKARFLFTANPSLRMSSGNHTLVADLNNVEVKCKLREGFEQAVPTGIPLVNLEANLIPGIELGGSYGAGRRSFEARLYASANVRFGFDCRASTGSCQNLSTGVNGTVQGNVILGETGTLGENIRDLKIGVFGDVKITGTAPLVGDIDLGSMREGYLMEYDLAPLANQIADNNPAGYTLRHYQVIDPFTSMRNLVSFLLGRGDAPVADN